MPKFKKHPVFKSVAKTANRLAKTLPKDQAWRVAWFQERFNHR